jgi:hypothetical protein
MKNLILRLCAIFARLLVLGVFLSPLLSFAAHKSSKSAEAKEFFPIMPWNHAPNDLAVLQKIRDCGFTVAGFAQVKTLKTCEKVGLKAIVSDPRVGGYDWRKVDAGKARSNVASLVNEVGRNPAVYGYYLRDEPPAGFFPGLENVASAVREFAPGKWPYMNLFPNYAENWQLETTGYAEYIEKFIATCHPTQLSFDHYPLLEGGGMRGNYWENLEAVATAARKHKLSFWSIALSVGGLSYRAPSAVDIRWEVYSSLLYGARGIAYFTYFAPPVGNYHDAPIDQFGNPTETWDHVRNINNQILKLAPTLLKLTSDDVYHFGTLPSGCHGPGEKSLVTAIDANFVVGDFTHADGSRYVMVMNKNMTSSLPCWPQFRNPPKALKLISAYSGTAVTHDGEQIWVGPGQGILLKLE